MKIMKTKHIMNDILNNLKKIQRMQQDLISSMIISFYLVFIQDSNLIQHTSFRFNSVNQVVIDEN